PAPATPELSTLSLHDALPISAVATEGFLARLAALLADPHKGVRSAAARAVGGLGAAAATEGFLARLAAVLADPGPGVRYAAADRSEEHTSELQSQSNLVCRLL